MRKGSTLLNGSWAVIGKLFVFLSNFIINILIVRMLVPTDVGSYFTYVSAITILASVLNLGFKEVFIHKLSSSLRRSEEEFVLTIRHFLYVPAYIGFLALVLIVSVIAICGLLFEVDVTLYLILVLYLVISNFQQYLAEVYRVLGDVKRSVLLGSLITNLSMVIVLFSAFISTEDISIRFIFAVFLISASIPACLGLISLNKKFSIYRSGSVNPEWSDLVRKAFPFFLSIVGLMLIQESYVWVTQALYDSREVALIGAAFRFIGIIAFPITILSFFVTPIIAQLTASNKLIKLELLIRTLSFIFFIPSALAYLFFVFLGSEILVLLFGDHYEQAYFCLVIICSGQLINIATGCNGSYLIVRGQGKVLMRATLIGGAFSLAMMIILGILFQIQGVAAGYAIGVAFVGVYSAVKIYKVDGVKTWIFPILKPRQIFRIVTLK